MSLKLSAISDSQTPQRAALGVGMVGSLVGLGVQAFSMLHRSERENTDWAIVSTYVVAFVSSGFALFRTFQQTKSGYEPLNEVRINENQDIEHQPYQGNHSIQKHDEQTPPNQVGVETPIDGAAAQKELEELRVLIGQTQAQLENAKSQLTELQSQKELSDSQLKSSMSLSSSYLQERSASEQKCLRLERELREVKKELKIAEEDHEAVSLDLQSKIVMLDDQLNTLTVQFQELLNLGENKSHPLFKKVEQGLKNARSLSASASATSSEPASPIKKSPGSNIRKEKPE